MEALLKTNPKERITRIIQTNPNGVRFMLDKLKVSNQSLVTKLENRKYSSKGDGSGCENTMFSETWDSWSDND